METTTEKNLRRSTLRKMNLAKFGDKNEYKKKNDPTTQIKSAIHHCLRDTRLYNQQSRCEKMNPVLNHEFNGSLVFDDEPIDTEASLRNGDWYNELSDIADSLGMPINQIPFKHVSLLETDWFCELVKLALYYEVPIWENSPDKQLLWLQEDAVNKRARENLSSIFKDAVLQIYDMIASEYDNTELDIEDGRQLIQSEEIVFMCDFDSAQVISSAKNSEVVMTVVDNPILTEVMERVVKILKAYATDIIDYAVYKAADKPM